MSYLVCDVAPVMLATQILEVLLEQCSHINDTICHALHFTEPLLVQGRIVKDLTRDTCTVYGRVGV